MGPSHLSIPTSKCYTVAYDEFEMKKLEAESFQTMYVLSMRYVSLCELYIKDALSWVKSKRWEAVTVESDSQQAVRAINNKNCNRSTIGMVAI